jgi:hypothetical protein
MMKTMQSNMCVQSSDSFRKHYDGDRDLNFQKILRGKQSSSAIGFWPLPLQTAVASMAMVLPIDRRSVTRQFPPAAATFVRKEVPSCCRHGDTVDSHGPHVITVQLNV